MSTRSSARNLFPPFDNPKLTIQRRSRADPTLLNNLEMAAEGNGDLPVLDLQTMEGLCQPSLNGRGGPIASIPIQEMNFGLKNDMIQQMDNLNQLIKQASRVVVPRNNHPYTPLRVCLTDEGEPYLASDIKATVGQTQNVYAAEAYQGGTFMKRRPEECYDLIENMIAHHNDWDTSAKRSESSSSITFSFDTEITALKAEMVEINKNLMRVLQVNQQVKA
nr:reverse transcriptase domain-containing protein [Tanacetum cinerariifolium]